jgi:hypothetical protein
VQDVRHAAPGGRGSGPFHRYLFSRSAAGPRCGR